MLSLVEWGSPCLRDSKGRRVLSLPYAPSVIVPQLGETLFSGEQVGWQMGGISGHRGERSEKGALNKL